MNDPLADLLDEIEGDYRTEAEFFAAQAEWLRANRERVLRALGGSRPVDIDTEYVVWLFPKESE